MRSEVFQVCVVDGVFEALPNALAVNFHAAMGLDEAAMAQVQADVRQRILKGIDEMNAHPVRFQWKNFDFQMAQ